MSRVTAILFGLAGALLPVGMVLSHRNVPVVLILIGLCGMAALKDFRPKPWMTASYALIVWAVITTLWSPYGSVASWVAYLGLLGLFGTAAMLAGSAREVRWIGISMLVCLMLLFIESISGGIIRDLIPPEGRSDKDDVATARGITLLLCLLPGLFLLLFDQLKRPVRWLPVFLIMAGVCAASFGIMANLLAFLTAIGAAGLVWFLPKWGLRLVLAGAILPIFLMPLLTIALPPIDVLSQGGHGPDTAIMRMIAWQALWDGVTDSPLGFLFGHGVEGTRIYGESLGKMRYGGEEIGINMIPTHPHNVYLQIWFDLGLVGALVTFVAMLMAARAFIRANLPRPVIMTSTALITATVIFALTDASLWTLWRVAGPLLGAWLILVAGRTYRGNTTS